MTAFKSGDISFNHAAQPHDFDRMRAQRFLLMVPKRDEQKQTRKKCDDDDADRGAGQELEMKMLWAEKPRDDAPKTVPEQSV